jgi:hypothetical protein
MHSQPSLQGSLSKSVARAQAGLALLLLAGLAGLDFFFPTNYRIQAGLHGLSSIASVVVGTMLTHRAYPLLRGVRANFRSLRHWVLGASVLNLLGVVSGNWIYMRYRGQDGPRDWILAKVPAFHNVLMEFKEFVSLFPLPLMVAVTFMLFYYGDRIYARRDLTQFVAIGILVSWFFLMLGFVAGLVLSKLRFV